MKKNAAGMRRKRIDWKMIIFTIAFVCVICFCAAGTVKSKGKGAASDNAAYYYQLENEYIMQARTVLNGRGLMNSGITMTHVIDENGARTYTVKLHHERLNSMTKAQENDLFQALNSIAFDDGQVLYEII